MQSHFPRYSTLFSTIYDQSEPVGQLGRGVHYSILRCAEWRSVTQAPLMQAQVHDFAVIWDEDHDVRVIQLIEQLYMEGLLSPVQFIGERKGHLTVIVAAEFYFLGHEQLIQNYITRIEKIADSFAYDSWSSDIGLFDKASGNPHQNDPKGIIQDSQQRTQTYLNHIDSLWNLGTKPFTPCSLTPIEEQ